MSERKDEPAPKRPLSSTLRHVKSVQQSVDVDVHWNNLHAKMQKWIEEAMRGENLRRQQQLVTAQRELLEAVRAQRQAVDAMVRELRTRLEPRDGDAPRDAKTPRH